MLELIGVDGLTQWDVGRQIKVDKDINMVHFSNRPYGYSKNVKVTNGVADVPDMFLTSCAPLRVWAYVGDFEKGYTKIEKIYEVKPKNRPEDYIYTPEEVKTWEKLQSEIGDLSNLETKAKENLVVAINEVAADMSEGVALDTTLTQSGQAADAKAVGDALAEKANIPDIPAALPNPNALTFTGAVTGSYDGSAAVTVNIPSGGSDGTDISLGLTSAAVGQTIKVKAIDESGKPTEWEAADMPSGESGEVKAWEEFMHFTVDNNETTVFDFSSNGAETLESKKAKEVYIYSPQHASGLDGTPDASGTVTVNGRVYISGLNTFVRPHLGSLKLWLCAKVDSLDLLYFGRDTDAGFGEVNVVCSAVSESNGLLSTKVNAKNAYRKIYTYENGIPMPSGPVDYIKTVMVSLSAPSAAGVEFIVYVR